jgi:DNA-binding NarL/FixJ family response regulator
MHEAFRAGASGFVLKVCDAEEFVKAIQTVSKGTVYTTPLLAGAMVSYLIRDGLKGHLTKRHLRCASTKCCS